MVASLPWQQRCALLGRTADWNCRWSRASPLVPNRVTRTPKKQSIVKLHQSDTPIFEQYGVERQIKTAFGRTVTMSKGAYLIIEHTEALHVIDVNSGNRSTKSKNQEETALE